MVEQTQHLILLIKRLNLKLAISREISFFLMCSVIQGYTYRMKKSFAFSHGAVCILGKGHFMQDYMDVECLSLKMEQFLQQQGGDFELKLLPSLIRDYKEIEKKYELATKFTSSEPFKTLELFLAILPEYFAVLGFYNTLWRYLDVSKKELSPLLLEKVSRERNLVASLYPKIDQTISVSSLEIGKQNNFDGDLLTFLSYYEMVEYVKSKNISQDMLAELSQRREHYFYLLVEDGSEYILSDKKQIDLIKNACFPEPETEGIMQLQGQGSYPGKVKGKVLLIFDVDLNHLPSDFILVANSTHPKDIQLIQKCSAMVIDEGGILSHATIISRELKKPCIVGTKIATKVFKDGDVVEVDANTGIIRKISK